MEINLISDTVTKPTKEMLTFMMNANVGDDVFKHDPTVNHFEEKIATLFGMEAALFFPSGTMANQTAIKIHTQPSEQLICDKWAHVYNFEAGGVAANSGVSCALIDGGRGMFTAEQVREKINDPNNYHLAKTSLVAIENTTNKGGGACWNIDELQKIKNVCKEHNLAYHLDGARLFNAMITNGETPKQYGKLFDTISICLSKGLGAPIGSALLGTKECIDKAIRIRKLFGGAMRQVGYLAAAGIYALDNNIERLAEDHKKAIILGKALDNSPLIKSVEPIETNIVIFYVIDSVNEQQFVDTFAKKNTLLTSMGQGRLRMVTHLDFTDEMLQRTVNEIVKLEL